MFPFLQAHILELLFVSTAAAFPSSPWQFHVDEDPAPSPENGPPGAANAIRDKKYLPAQVSAIIGAYVLFVVCIGTAVLLVGRRLRRAAQGSPRTLAMEMMKPVKSDVPKAFDPSPISPASRLPYGKSPASTVDTREMWPSPQKSDLGYSWSNNKGHNKQVSMQSSVITFDESVIEDDKERNQREMERLYAAVMEHDEHKSTTTLNKTAQQPNPPEFQHLRTSSNLHNPSFPPPTESQTPGISISTSPRKHTRPTPISTSSRASSRSSFGSFSKKRPNIRNLPISPPMGSPDLVPEYSSTYGEAEPLGPRLYDPGPPPPTPPQREAYALEQRMDATRLSPRHAEFPRTSIHPASRRDSEASHETKSSSRQKRAPAPLSIKTEGALTASSQPSLRTAPLPLRNLNSSRLTADRPPSTIKATVVESKPRNRHLDGPRTGVPMTPYSPYMPYTPLTPMTPSRLVTREERKKKEKEEGRRVATIADKVEEEGDMWGDAY